MTPDQAAQLDACSHGVNDMKVQIDRVLRLLNGNPDDDIPGVRPRLYLVERRVSDIPLDLPMLLGKIQGEIDVLEAKWLAVENQVRGGKMVVSIIGVGNLVGLLGLVATLIKVFG